ncbi:MAG: methyltransferase [Phenylobacterium sp.]|nr:MAG: methyltransferase [Phenylobacterium sp.]
MKMFAGALLAGLALGAAAYAAAPAVKPYLAAALADPARGDMTAVDARRHTAELMAFSGVRPGDKVVDLIPGSGLFTRVFAKVAGPKGHVYMVWPDQYAQEAASDVVASDTLAKDRAYGNISVLRQPAAAFATPEKVDLVFTAQNYHDYPDKFMGKVDPVAFDKQVYEALKPGGVFLVIDHAADAGSGMRDTDTLHRIDPAIVKQQVTSVGFVYEGASGVLRNPADDHKKVVFDKTIRGKTDQFVFKFRKPKK